LFAWYSAPPWRHATLLDFSQERSNWSSPSFSSTFQNFPRISDLLPRSVQNLAPYRALLHCNTLIVSFLSLSPICWWKGPSSCWKLLLPKKILHLNSRVLLAFQMFDTGRCSNGFQKFWWVTHKDIYVSMRSRKRLVSHIWIWMSPVLSSDRPANNRLSQGTANLRADKIWRTTCSFGHIGVSAMLPRTMNLLRIRISASLCGEAMGSIYYSWRVFIFATFVWTDFEVRCNERHHAYRHIYS